MNYFPGKPFQLPQQRQRMYLLFWPPRKVAREWGVPYRAALRYMLRNPQLCAWVRVEHADGRIEWILCLNLEECLRAEE